MDEPPRRIYEPTDPIRRRIYQLSFRNQVLLFTVLGLVTAVLLLIYVVVVTRLMFSPSPPPTPTPQAALWLWGLT